MATTAKKSTKSKKKSTGAKKKPAAGKKKTSAKRVTSARKVSSALERVEGIEPIEPTPVDSIPIGEGKKRSAESTITPITATPTAGGGGSGLFGSGSASKKDVTYFFRQLIMLVNAGTPILKALNTLSARGRHEGIKNLVADLARYVEAGNPLWQAFERHPKHFTPMEIQLIRASEASGTLTEVLERVARYRERREVMHKKMQGAAMYPLAVMIVCFLVIALMCLFVVPQFRQIFDQVRDLEIPWYTEFFFGLADLFPYISIGGFVGVAALILLYKFWFVKTPLGRLRADRIKLSLPIVGPILQKNAIVDFARTFALLQRSGLSILVTLDLVEEAISNKALANVMRSLSDSVERGEGLEQPMRAVENIIPPMVTDMFVTGEESGSVDKIADHVADTYEEEVEIQLNTLGEAIQPIIIVFMGLIVLAIAAALFVPLVGMLSALSSSGV